VTAVLDAGEDDLWERYRDGRDESARDRLFLHHLSWATSIARGVHYRLRAYQVDRDDFVQNATIGLLEAMSRYDPGRGVAFRAYAQPRIRGAVFNGLRAIIGQRSPASENAAYEARLQSIRDAADGDAFATVIETIVGLGIAFLLDEAARHAGIEGRDASAYAQHSESETRLKLAMARLGPRHRMIIEAHYFQFVPFQDIAAQLGLTKGRVSQLHHAALARLRDDLRELF